MSLVRSPISGIVRGAVSGIVLSADDGPSLDLNYAALAALTGRETFTRSSSATDLLYTASIGAYSTFASNAARVSSSGLLIEESRTQQLGVTDSPATQTVTLSSTGSYTCWMIGSGSVAVSAGTATITGAGSATQGTPLTFNVTATGTVTFTVSGTVTRFQCEKGGFATSYIPNSGAAGTTVTRAAEVCAVATSAFGYSSIAGTFVVEFAMGPNPNFGAIAGLDDNADTNKVALALSGGGKLSVGLITSGTGAVSLQDGSLSMPVVSGATHKAAVAWRNGYARAALDGTLSSTTLTAAGTFGMTQVDLGKDGLNRYANALIRRFRYWPRSLSEAELQALTT